MPILFWQNWDSSRASQPRATVQWSLQRHLWQFEAVTVSYLSSWNGSRGCSYFFHSVQNQFYRLSDLQHPSINLADFVDARYLHRLLFLRQSSDRKHFVVTPEMITAVSVGADGGLRLQVCAVLDPSGCSSISWGFFVVLVCCFFFNGIICNWI